MRAIRSVDEGRGWIDERRFALPITGFKWVYKTWLPLSAGQLIMSGGADFRTAAETIERANRRSRVRGVPEFTRRAGRAAEPFV